LTFKAAPNFESPTDTGGNNVYEVTVAVSDDGTPTATDTQAFTITVTDVNEAPLAQGDETLSGTVGQTFTDKQLSATDPDAGDTANLSFVVTEGALPSGLTLSPSGLISGTPTALTPAAGTPVTITVSDGLLSDTIVITFFIRETQSLVVNTTSDVVDAFDSSTSLREAIVLANAQEGEDTITFDADVFAQQQTITLTYRAPVVLRQGVASPFRRQAQRAIRFRFSPTP
jgi:serralysin